MKLHIFKHTHILRLTIYIDDLLNLVLDECFEVLNSRLYFKWRMDNGCSTPYEKRNEPQDILIEMVRVIFNQLNLQIMIFFYILYIVT